MIFLVTAAAFVVLAFLLDRLFPAGIPLPFRSKGSSGAVEEPEFGEASSAAELERRAQARSRV